MSDEMNCSPKKIKLDPDLVKKEPHQEEEAEDKDDVHKFEVVLGARDGNLELQPEYFFLKEEKEEDSDLNSHEMDDGNLPVNTGDDPESESSKVKSDKTNIASKTVRDFMCTTCSYVTKKPMEFTKHWVRHAEQPYTNEHGVYVCQISGCFYVVPTKEDILKHIASTHLYRYRCDFCHYVTFSKSDYDQHRTTHYTYQCIKCDLQATKLFFVQDHVKTPLKCETCDFASHHWFPYKKHVNRHQYPPDSIVKCGFCDFATGNQALLGEHRVDCRKRMFCKICNFAGMDIAELAEHCKNTHDTTLEAVDKLHKCKFCTCKFIGLGSKEKHEEVHSKNGALLKCCSNSRTVQCPYCDHQENKRNDMHLHILSKHAAALELDGFRFGNTPDEIVPIGLEFKDDDVGIDKCRGDQDTDESEQEANNEDTEEREEKTGIIDDEEADKSQTRQIILRCPMCPHLSNSKFDFDRHLIKKHKSKPGTKKFTFCCSRCSFTTNNRALLFSHLAVHRTQKKENELEAGPSRYTCSFCSYESPSKEDYDLHCKTHNTFKCTKCEFECTKRLFVDDHLEQPWACPKCEYKAHHWLPMKIHSFTHNKQGPVVFKCNQCDYVTTHQSVLKRHVPIHKTVLIPCKICKFKTKYEESLQYHYANVHDGNSLPPEDGNVPSDERPYECDFCACKFKHQVYLDKHVALHGDNGPFRKKCGQCLQVTRSKIVKGTTSRKENEPDSWKTCPYCSYKDEARYKMIDHLSRTHLKELENEPYCEDC